MYHVSLIFKGIIKIIYKKKKIDFLKVYEEPEEPLPEEEIAEEPPIREEVEEVAPPRGTAAFMHWMFERGGVLNLSQTSSLSNVHQYTLLESYK